MNKTVELVNHWAAFENAHPNADLSDFYRYMLIKEREGKEEQHVLSETVPQDVHSKFARIIGRIAKIHMGLCLPILREYGINSFEDFPFLNSMYKLENPKKTEVITLNFIELSSGLLIIERLKKNGWIIEKDDEVDKRSKRLFISPEGVKVMEEIYKRMSEFNQQCFGYMSEDDIQLCIQLMSPVEASLTTSWLTKKANK